MSVAECTDIHGINILYIYIYTYIIYIYIYIYVYGNHRDIQLIHTTHFWLVYIYNYRSYIYIYIYTSRRAPYVGQKPYPPHPLFNTKVKWFWKTVKKSHLHSVFQIVLRDVKVETFLMSRHFLVVFGSTYRPPSHWHPHFFGNERR